MTALSGVSSPELVRAHAAAADVHATHRLLTSGNILLMFSERKWCRPLFPQKCRNVHISLREACLPCLLRASVKSLTSSSEIWTALRRHSSLPVLSYLLPSRMVLCYLLPSPPSQDKKALPCPEGEGVHSLWFMRDGEVCLQHNLRSPATALLAPRPDID